MSPAVRLATVTDTPLSVDAVLAAVADPSVGGIGVFLGVVRDTDDGQDVRSLDYTAHPSAAEELRRCAQRVADQHDVVSVAVTHRVGHLEIGELAVVVAVGAVHRAEALSACSQLIDDVKGGVPIWKEQAYTSGAVGWVGLP